ncbi:MAG: alkaline phosphatase family protein, partial [Bacillota bacterium]
LVLDGLRPDSVNAQDTPNLGRLRTEGVTFANTHAVFPTVTRVNAAAIGSGTYPEHNGMMGNTVFIPAVDPKRAFNNDNARSLLKLGDDILTVPSLAELMQKAGEKLVVVSSGSTGGAILLAPRSPKGMGTVIHGLFDGQASYPREPGDEVLRRFGSPPTKGGPRDSQSENVAWAVTVLTDYVLPELKPRVAIAWFTEPDHTQHAYGVGSPQSLDVIRRDDALVGRILERLSALGLADRTNIVVISDHGFSQKAHEVDARGALKEAGLATEDDLVIASSGQAVALHVKDRDRERIAKIAQFLEKQPWCGLVFTAAAHAGAHEGSVAGTFSLEEAHLGGHERSPDIVFTFPWSSARNGYGVPGADDQLKGGPGAANHGGIGPWTVRNTMLAWGPDFKRGAIVRTPSANVDVAATIAYLLGMNDAVARMDGRPLVEALANGPDEEQMPMEVRTLRVANGAYRAVLQVSEVAGKRYLDKGWRVP